MWLASEYLKHMLINCVESGIKLWLASEIPEAEGCHGKGGIQLHVGEIMYEALWLASGFLQHNYYDYVAGKSIRYEAVGYTC